jgi:lipopolysaccharide transport system ATP-binding protein
MPESVIVQNLGKQYLLYRNDRPWTLQESVLSGLWRLRPTQRFWALREINFCLSPGSVLGILGENGVGKSTLLRLIGGVGIPDEGSIQVNGRIGALLSLGAGFHSDLTGRENVYINGVINGLLRKEVEQRFDSIVSYAELENDIDKPLRTYSSGMWMRLAFSVAVHVDPQVLLIDEILMVGDIRFQKKCLERINQIRNQGCAILLVSHDLDMIARFCDEAIWLDAGHAAAVGPAKQVCEDYLAAMGTNN